MPRILWADDEIDLLRPHVLFLEGKGYDVTSVTNGADAVEQVREGRFDVVFLDEQMPGMGGLEALAEIKGTSPETPVVMITKSEEEHLMEDAIGRQIADYLIKPVNPRQILMTCKRLLEGGRLREERVSQNYLQAFGALSARISGGLDLGGWVDVYQQLVRHGLDLDADDGARQILDDQYREANREFGRFVEGAYEGWIEAASARARSRGRPAPLSPDVHAAWVLPRLGERPVRVLPRGLHAVRPVARVRAAALPALRRGEGLARTPSSPRPRRTRGTPSSPGSSRTRSPGATRTSGSTTPATRARSTSTRSGSSSSWLQRKHKGDARVRYEKIVSSEAGQALAATDLAQHDLAAVVVNFVDILAHSRSDSSILKEIAPDERAYRALTRTWFEHSWLSACSRTSPASTWTPSCSPRTTASSAPSRPSKVIGDRDTSTSPPLQARPQPQGRRQARHLREEPGGLRAPAHGDERELHLREGGLLLRLPHELPPLPQPVHGHVPARGGLAGGDAAAGDDPAPAPMTPPPLADLLPAETVSPSETMALGRKLAEGLRPGDVLALYGDLGAGKTHLAKGVCAGLGIAPEDVTSPTFTIAQEYEGRLPVYHLDAYRIERLAEMAELGYETYFFGDGVALVEWPERIEPLLPDYTIRLRLTHLGEDRRRIEAVDDGDA
jgi:tRNA threonylcarbamoyl adenosine modification protein YjeE